MHAFIPIVALLGLAAAQSESSNSASSTSSAPAPGSTAACLADCAVGDVDCQAVCVNVPAPNESQIDATLQCSRNECTQGDSGPEDTKKYGECLASCAQDFYYTSGTTPTGVATAGASATGASTPADSTAGSTTGTGSAAESTESSSHSGSSHSSAASSAASSGASAASSASSSAAAEATGAAAALSLSTEMLTLSGGAVGLLVAALAL
ncbi:hypothetical protein MBLNU13_g04791t1 [Cladosporium sp. NU13]